MPYDLDSKEPQQPEPPAPPPAPNLDPEDEEEEITEKEVMQAVRRENAVLEEDEEEKAVSAPVPEDTSPGALWRAARGICSPALSRPE